LNMPDFVSASLTAYRGLTICASLSVYLLICYGMFGIV
jgi:hypothetical protein